MKKVVAFLSLFTSFGTLLCCALPALFVVLGFGAAFAGLIGNVPQLIWFSENKTVVFVVGAVLLSVGGYLEWNSKRLLCPVDPSAGEACKTTRSWSVWVYFVALGLYLVGATFAFFPYILAIGK